MAEISLRSYLRKVESLIQEGALEEAVAHCRRILEYYPRNALAYRLLGQALVQQSRWQEAAEIFRRLLSALPGDFIAHEQLSWVHEKLKQPDQAIFHLERAFEAQPNNKNVITRLRELYATYRNTTIEKVQLTAGALAGQYINRGMNEQAIAVLQAALQRSPERSDLKLQLARALWNVGQTVDSAEVAIEVLNDLPYALPANRILTELWLQEQRPSDAQRYLSRIEDVDPYLAIRIATGDNVTPETFMLPELDYAEYAHEAISAQRPDWLESLETGTAFTAFNEDTQADDEDWLQALESDSAPTPAATQRRVTDTLSNLLPETEDADIDMAIPMADELPSDVIRRIDAFKNAAAEETIAAPLPDDLNFFDDVASAEDDNDAWMKELGIETDERPSETIRRTGLTGRLSLMETQAKEPEEDDSWLMDLPDFVDESAAQQPVTTDEDDFFAAAEFESFEEDTAPGTASTGLTDLLGAIGDDDDGDFEDDDLEWLSAEDDDIELTTTHVETRPAGGTDDAFAWMRDSGIEIDENAPSKNPLLDFAADFDDADLNLKPAGSTDWMRDSGVEYADHALPDFEADSAQADEDLDNPLAWLSGDDFIDDASEPQAPLLPVRPSAASRSTPPPQSKEPAIIADESALEEMLELESLLGSGDFLSDTAADAADMEAPAAPVDWQEMMPDDTPNWQPDDNDDSDLESMDWFSDEDLLSDTDSDDAIDFFAEETPIAESPKQPEAGFQDFFAEDDELAADSELEADGMAWLTDDDLLLDDELGIESPAAAPASRDFFADPSEIEIEDEAAEADSMAWLSDDLLVEEDALGEELPGELDEAAEADSMAWLSDDLLVEDALGEEQPGELDEAAEADSMAWLSDDLLVEEDAIAEPNTVSTLQTDLFAGDNPEFTEDDAAPDFLPIDAVEQDVEQDSMAWLGEDALLDDALLNEDEIAELDAIPFASDDDEQDDVNYLALSDEEAHDLANMGEFATASDWLDDSDLLDDLASDEFDGDDSELADEVAAGFLDNSGVPAAEVEVASNVSDRTTEWDVDDEAAFAWDSFEDDSDVLDAGELDDLAYADEDAALVAEMTDDDAFAWDDAEESFGTDEPDWLNNLNTQEEPALDFALPDNLTTENEFDSLEVASEHDWLADSESEMEADDADQFVPLTVQSPLNWQSDDSAEDDDFMADDFAMLDDDGMEERDLDWMVDAEIEDAYPWDDAEEEAPSPTASMTNLLNTLEANRYDETDDSAEVGFDWGSELEDTDVQDDFVAQETPDWLNAVSDDDEDENAVVFASAAEDDLDDVYANITDDDLALSEEEVGWLSDLDVSDEEVALLEEEDASFEWQPEEEFTDDDFVVAEEPDWMAQIGTDDAVPDEDEFAPISEAASGWGVESELEDENTGFEWQPEEEFTDDDFVVAEEPDWMAQVGADDEFAAPIRESDVEDEDLDPVLETDAGPDWLAILGESDPASDRTTIIPPDEDDLMPAASLAEMPEMGYSSDTYDEEIDAIPASNAPDWLNAMVPGLDLDYAASGEDALAAPDVVPDAVPVKNRNKAEFDWLQTIVDEETGAMESVVDSPPPPPQEKPSVARFIFSRLPAWLRPSESAVSPVGAVGEAVAVPDYLDNFDEFEREYNADTDEDQFADLDDFDFDDDDTFNK